MVGSDQLEVPGGHPSHDRVIDADRDTAGRTEPSARKLAERADVVATRIDDNRTVVRLEVKVALQ